MTYSKLDPDLEAQLWLPSGLKRRGRDLNEDYEIYKLGKSLQQEQNMRDELRLAASLVPLLYKTKMPNDVL